MLNRLWPIRRPAHRATGHYVRVTSPLAALGVVESRIRYVPAARELTPANRAHRDRASLGATPIAGRVPRTDRGFLRAQARKAATS